MKIQIVLFCLLSIFMIGSLSGCNRLSSSYTAEKNKFIGSWTYIVPSGTDTNYSFRYSFFSNGTFNFNKNGLITNGTFDIIDGNLFLTYSTNGTKQYDEFSYVFSENNTKLTINRTLYTKQ